MGATRNTGYLENLIQYDASDNVAIATSVNPTYKVTLGGSMLGTSAVFSGLVTANANIRAAGIIYGRTTNNFPTTGAGYYAITTNNFDAERGGITIQVSSATNTLTTALSINYLGAATFSSSVTANTNIDINAADTSTSPYIRLNQSGGNTFGVMGINRADGTGVATGLASALVFRSGAGTDYPIQFATANNVRMTITSGGNVGIGTTSPAAKLHLSGDFELGDAIRISSTFGTGRTYRIKSQGGNADVLSLLESESGNRLAFFGNTEAGIATGGTTRLYITSGGDFLFGKTNVGVSGVGQWFQQSSNFAQYSTIANSNNTYHVYDNTNSVYRFYVTGGGTIFATNTTISSISDIRLKENIRDINYGLDAILSLKPRVFDWKKESGNSGKNVRGFIAQEFEKIFPDLIDEWKGDVPDGEEPYKSIRADLIPVLVKAIQELNQKIEAFENK